jgi:hypothetical protein
MGSGGTMLVGAGQTVFKPFQNSLSRFKQTLNHSNFNRSKKDLPELENFGLKYDSEDLEKVNNFVHRNFFRFRMNFKLKFKELSILEFDRI